MPVFLLPPDIPYFMLNKLAVFNRSSFHSPLPWLMENPALQTLLQHRQFHSSASKIWCAPRPQVSKAFSGLEGGTRKAGFWPRISSPARTAPACKQALAVAEADHKQEVILAAGSDAGAAAGPSLRRSSAFPRLLRAEVTAFPDLHLCPREELPQPVFSPACSADTEK